jgi:hypothetical protein
MEREKEIEKWESLVAGISGGLWRLTLVSWSLWYEALEKYGGSVNPFSVGVLSLTNGGLEESVWEVYLGRISWDLGYVIDPWGIFYRSVAAGSYDLSFVPVHDDYVINHLQNSLAFTRTNLIITP